ncbi:MAG: hypothetical protein FJ288_01640 [Planctomycetes bacterium]|nr:hypothetical protein [Planctomycetota bacterium]
MGLLAAVAWLPAAGCVSPGPARDGLRAAAFECDATPPAGHPACGGWIAPLGEVEAPLLLKGIVLADSRTRYVVASLDWCRLHNGACDLFRRKMASAACVAETQVAVHCTHAHDAPLADTEAQRLLDRAPSAPPHLDLRFMDEVTDRAAAAVRGAIGRLRPFTHVGAGRAKVEQFASARRVFIEGTLHVRSSATKAPAVRDAPEGKIDPWLRTVTLFEGGRPILRMHYYASHLHNNYGDGKADPDVAGLARAAMEKEEGIPHLYFSGCCGDVTVGKYNVGPAEDVHRQLAERLAAGMRAAIAATETAPVSEIGWKTVEVVLPLREDGQFAEETLRRQLGDAAERPERRLKAALALAWRERVTARPGIDAGRLRLGPVTILHLPGEAFVEFQLYAQSILPNGFVAVAANGEGGPGYICTDAAFSEGGYEPTMSVVGPPTEALLKEAIRELLR